MSYYIRRGNTFSQTDGKALDIHDSLPVGTYTVKFNPETGYYFEMINDFTLPKKTYGDLGKNVTRIHTTFNDRSASTGVLLAGEKGSGKTLLAKALSVAGLNVGVPTVVINTPHCGETFNTFIQQMEQPAVILFDEFEKIYSQEEQEQVLTLLDGVYPTKKLFVITANDKWRIDQHMRNRPGRIFYALDFDGLDTSFIEEYAKENLKDASLVDSVINVGGMFSAFNFDMLKALVEEMNRYGETAQEALTMLNAKPVQGDNRNNYDISVTVAGVEVAKEFLYEETWSGNPFSHNLTIYVSGEGGKKASEDEKILHSLLAMADNKKNTEWEYSFTLNNKHLVKVDGRTGTYVYNILHEGKEVVVTLTKQKSEEFDYSKFA